MLVELLLGTGIRIGSALALDVGDLDFDHGEIKLRTTKNDRPTTAVLPASVAKSLEAFGAERTEGAVFLAGDHRVSMRHAQRRLASWFAVAGIVGSRRSRCAIRSPASCSTARATFGSCRRRNHASIVSTSIYTMVHRATLRAAAGI